MQTRRFRYLPASISEGIIVITKSDLSMRKCYPCRRGARGSSDLSSNALVLWFSNRAGLNLVQSSGSCSETSYVPLNWLRVYRLIVLMKVLVAITGTLSRVSCRYGTRTVTRGITMRVRNQVHSSTVPSASGQGSGRCHVGQLGRMLLAEHARSAQTTRDKHGFHALREQQSLARVRSLDLSTEIAPGRHLLSRDEECCRSS
jgi:hypothetical protein